MPMLGSGGLPDYGAIGANATRAAASSPTSSGGSGGAWNPASAYGGAPQQSSTSVWDHSYASGPRRNIRGRYGADADRNYTTGTDGRRVLERDAQGVLDRLGAMSGPELVRLQKAMYDAGLYGSTKAKGIKWGYVDDKTAGGFEELLSMAARAKAGGSPKSWQQILAELSANQAGADGSGSGGGPSSGVRRSTDSQVTLTGRGDAEETLRGAMQDLLGRAPGEDEVGRFLSRLNAAERKSPTVRSSTERWSDDGAGNTTSNSSSTVRQSDVNPNVQARDSVIRNNGAEVSEFGIGSLVGLFEQMVGA